MAEPCSGPRRSKRRRLLQDESKLEIPADEGDFKLKFIDTYIGHGVFATRSIEKGACLLEYKGRLLDPEENTSCSIDTGFKYFFHHNNRTLCIDATTYEGLGKMINDQRTRANCKMKKVSIDQVPRLFIFAQRDINNGEELRYDYGVQNLPWRKLKDPGSHTADPGPTSSDPGSPIADPVPTSLDPGSPTADPGPTSLDQGSPTADPGPTSLDPGSPTADPGSPTADPGSPTADPGPTSLDPGSPTADPGSPTADSGTHTSDPGSPSTDSGTPTADPGLPTADPGPPSADSGTHTSDFGSPTAVSGQHTSDISSTTAVSGPPTFTADSGPPSADLGLVTSDLGPTSSDPGSPTSDPGSPTSDSGSPTSDSCSPIADSGLPTCTADSGPVTTDPGPPTSDPGSTISDSGSPTSDSCSPIADSGPVTTDPGPPTSDPGSPISDSGPPTAYPGPLSADPGPPTSDLGPPIVDSGSLTAVSGQRLVGSGQRTCTSYLGPASANSESASAAADEGHFRTDHTDIHVCLASSISSATPRCLTTQTITLTTQQLAALQQQHPVNLFQEDGSTVLIVAPTTQAHAVTEQGDCYKQESYAGMSEPDDYDDSDLDPDFKCDDADADSSDSDDEGLYNSPRKRVKKSDNRQISTPDLDVPYVSDSEDSVEIQVQPNLNQFNNKHQNSSETMTSSDTNAGPSETFGLFPKGVKKEHCKQIYDKVNYCTYCGKTIKSKISRHILSVHKSEQRVSDIILLPKQSRARKVYLEVLANEGNFKHNINVLKNRDGFLVVGRRETKVRNVKPGDYLPCEYCKKFIMKETLWLHHKNCIVNRFYMKESAEKMAGTTQIKYCNNAIRHARSLLNSALLEESDHLLAKMLDRMHNDEISDVVRHDMLIKKYAVLRVESLGSEKDQKINDMHRVSQCCRTLARLVMRCKEKNTSSIIDLDRLISTEHFDLVVSSTKSMCTDKKDGSVSLGRYMGNLLAHMIQIKKGDALRKNSNSRLDQAEHFQRLYDSEWNYRVNSVFQKRSNTLNRQKVRTVPLTSDLQKLRDYIMTSMKSLSTSLKESKLPEEWTKLSKLTCCRLILFNKRRRAEVKDLKCQDYQNRPNWKVEQKGEFEMALSTADKLLAERMDMVISAGKSRKNVDAYVLLPPDAKGAIDLLISMRKDVGIPSNNPYIFARMNSCSPLTGNTDLREIVDECPGLENPERISSTSLRKYIATVSQILDMTDPELDMLAKHLGHDVKTHKENYRLSHSTRELTVVSQLLMAVDSGCVNKWKGRNLKDINVDDLPSLEQYEDSEDELQHGEVEKTPYDQAEERGDQAEERGGQAEERGYQAEERGDLAEEGIDQAEVLDPPGPHGDQSESTSQRVVKKTVSDSKRGRQAWTDGERDYLKTKFRYYLAGSRTSVHNVDMLAAQEDYPVLRRRTLAQIRAKLNNMKLGKSN